MDCDNELPWTFSLTRSFSWLFWLGESRNRFKRCAPPGGHGETVEAVPQVCAPRESLAGKPGAFSLTADLRKVGLQKRVCLDTLASYEEDGVHRAIER